jgi:hypothetical protein
VVKTSVNGEIKWSLPCQLDVGLPSNPRGVDEGLACYFLRLFNAGITGRQGPPGCPGTNGTNGYNAYTVVAKSFPQPTLANPLTQVSVFADPAMIAGLTVFIAGSGTYLITDAQPGGVLTLTLIQPVSNPGTTVPIGALVVPSGPAIPGPQGVQGVQGIPGIQGLVGGTVAVDAGLYSSLDSIGGVIPGRGDFGITGGISTVVFGSSTPGFAPAYAGTYLVTVSTVVQANGTPGPSDSFNMRLRTSDGIIFYPTQYFVTGFYLNEIRGLSFTATVTTTGTVGQKVQLQAWAGSFTAGLFSVMTRQTLISWARVA